MITRNTPMQQSFINTLFDQAIELRTVFFELERKCDAKIAAQNIVMLSFDDVAMKDLRYLHMTPPPIQEW